MRKQTRKNVLRMYDVSGELINGMSNNILEKGDVTTMIELGKKRS